MEKVGKVIRAGGAGVTISSQSGWRMPALTPEQDELLATTPTEQLLELDMFQAENIQDTLHAYQIAKRCNTGSTFLMDGGATASYFYGPLKP